MLHIIEEPQDSGGLEIILIANNLDLLEKMETDSEIFEAACFPKNSVRFQNQIDVREITLIQENHRIILLDQYTRTPPLERYKELRHQIMQRGAKTMIVCWEVSAKPINLLKHVKKKVIPRLKKYCKEIA